ncbi:MAG: helix-turn-helix domain-containing protein, partial [Verrucomicrobia bacterium]|nr:helix-turn-helix domain-containing protein [Verrucomicrobiota bacterium]
MSDNPPSFPPFIPSWLDDRGLTPHQFRVLCHLHRRAGKDGKCRPSAPSIAATCRINRDTVWPVLERLEELGLIAKLKKGFAGANNYLLKSPIGGNEAPV